MTRTRPDDRQPTLDARFGDHLRASGWLDGTASIVVGVSGGIDSMVLLHLLRFGGIRDSVAIHVAHVDHRMRPDSAEDAGWLAEICTDWNVGFHLHTASPPVTGEAQGRKLRYEFYEEVRRGLDGRAVTMTAHTADDQAETVLFRIARGSGPRGLRAIHAVRPPFVFRPLLPFWRHELIAFAAERGIPHRDDPSNLDPRWARNRLRHAVLPVLEEAVPGAAAALVALAETSRLQSAALDELIDERIAALSTRPPVHPPDVAPSPASPGRAPPASPGPGALTLDRDALRALSDPVLALVLRRAVTRLGGEPSRGATAEMLRFVRESASGRRLRPTRTVTVEHRLDEVRIRRATRPAEPYTDPGAGSPPGPGPPPGTISGALPSTPPLHIGSEPGQGWYARNGWLVEAAWGPAPRLGYPHVAHFAPDSVSFPLSLRPWAPGDRMRMSYGIKKVKKVLLEARIPADRRDGVPVVADAAGTVRWIPGIGEPYATASEAVRQPPSCCVEVRVRDAPHLADIRNHTDTRNHADRGGPG